MGLAILFLGDVVGRVGRTGVAKVLKHWKTQLQPDVIIANAENIAHGKGITRATIEELRVAGVDAFTSGNHVFRKPEIYDFIEDPKLHITRPANYPPGVAGSGATLVPTPHGDLLLINTMGRVFMHETLDCPFQAVDSVLADYQNRPHVATFVDMHAEATSEKIAFGHYLDGRVSAVVGTHTHVATADAEILPGGTAYITDVGMCGYKGGVLGVDKANVLHAFLTQEPVRHEIPEAGLCAVNGVLVVIDASNGKAISIRQLHEEVMV
ncbi:MAG: TIGR00282 family metallophosphoesterase [Patescibacteria group bacterium]